MFEESIQIKFPSSSDVRLVKGRGPAGPTRWSREFQLSLILRKAFLSQELRVPSVISVLNLDNRIAIIGTNLPSDRV